jgi:hypothetical protein
VTAVLWVRYILDKNLRYKRTLISVSVLLYHKFLSINCSWLSLLFFLFESSDNKILQLRDVLILCVLKLWSNFASVRDALFLYDVRALKLAAVCYLCPFCRNEYNKTSMQRLKR